MPEAVIVATARSPIGRAVKGSLATMRLDDLAAQMVRAVRLGADRGGAEVEVLAGLRPGEPVAVDALKAGLADARPARPARAAR